MEKSEKIFSGLAIDVRLIKKYLESNGIKCYADNSNASANNSKWAGNGFDPCIDLMVDETQASKARQLVEEFLNTKAE